MDLSLRLTWITGLMTRINAGPIPLQSPLMPSFLMISFAASKADGLILVTLPSV